ncbi:MAG: hypothetical protein GEV08_16160 [Acidimicrobiia bacterium]|nr:hypothetical protein [Acidimicrobiia bacterium]
MRRSRGRGEGTGPPPAMAPRSDVTAVPEWPVGMFRKVRRRRLRRRTTWRDALASGAVLALLLASFAQSAALPVGLGALSGAGVSSARPALPGWLAAVPVGYLVAVLGLEGLALAAAGALGARRARPGHGDADAEVGGGASAAPPAPPEPAATTDELVAAVGDLLVGLRRQFGVRYGSRTWVEEVLPSLLAVPDEPLLVRDLLAVSALEAAGVCPDVSGLTSAHSPGRLDATAAWLHEALTTLSERLGASEDMGWLPPFEAVSWDGRAAADASPGGRPRFWSDPSSTAVSRAAGRRGRAGAGGRRTAW